MTYDDWKTTDPADLRPRERSAHDTQPRGEPCYTCKKPVHRIYTLAGIGYFCSPRCRSQAMDAPSKSEVA